MVLKDIYNILKDETKYTEVFKKPNLLEKKKLIDDIIFHCFYKDENNLLRYDMFFKEIMTSFVIIYHNLVESNTLIDDLYDIDDDGNKNLILEKLLELYEKTNRVIDWYKQNIYNFSDDLKEAINYEKTVVNSISYVFSTKINELLSKLPDLNLEKIIEKINEISPQQRKLIEKAMRYNESSEIINKVTELTKAEKKK